MGLANCCPHSLIPASQPVAMSVRQHGQAVLARHIAALLPDYLVEVA